MKLIYPVSILLALGGCAHQSTAQMIADVNVPKKTVAFTSNQSIDELIAALTTKSVECLGEKVDVASTAVVGAGVFFPIVTSMNQKLELSTQEDGVRWLALRMDGSMVQAVAAALKFTADQSASNTAIEAFPANKKKESEIKAAVESGDYFCVWRGLDYPWD